MQKCKVRSSEDALAYLIDCQLATVQSMAMKKSRQKHDYSRQTSIAQTGVDFLKEFKIPEKNTRADEIISKNITVSEWLRGYEV